MKKIWVLMWVVCCAIPVARADEASKAVKAEKLMTLMHMDQMMHQMTDAVQTQMKQAMDQSFDGKSLTDKQKAIQTDFQNKLIKLILDSVSWDSMKPVFVKVYIDSFSDEELDGMVAFYSSPVGQSVLTKMPKIMSASMNLAQTRMMDLQPKLKSMGEDYAAQMKAASN